MRQLIKGFDYQLQRPLELKRREWIARMTAAVQAGGKRVVENGETIVVSGAPEPRVQFEVYTTLPGVRR
jgi:hypothetical protein